MLAIRLQESKWSIEAWGERERATYKNPSDKIRMTESFVLGFIFIFQTKKTGKIPKLQSVTALIAACA